MRKVYVIGIGAGDPDQLTVQAVRALRRVDVFFLLDKGAEKSDLIALRHEILRRHAGESAGGRGYRLVEVRDPERERAADGAGYPGTVDDWRSRRAALYERAIVDELSDGDGPDGTEGPDLDRTGAFLVWGDPSLYDSTLPILDEILARGSVRFEYEVIPGISSVSALAARHRVGLTRVGRPVQITTGRRLAEGWPDGVDDVVVMLDAHESFRHQLASDLVIHWGAYVGTDDEILVSGRLSEVADRIGELRSEARARKGWIMDTYLLRRDPGPSGGSPRDRP
ncbi:precorrin-6A synthase (deacetylating) [Streptomyces scopuliridis]|uniref:precorrin-6A synthase (deacetylating) n=1 Tax=Streptomyces scopuliridis TaxID=452529 RepID=UPI002DDAA35D|nr:precorrin-6A synthase (deacetylating) [Streptomyces scopuliridis]WSB37367.1 precorrin-6A synthase (deacetylating) [Streptomyces scopuliridis]